MVCALLLPIFMAAVVLTTTSLVRGSCGDWLAGPHLSGNSSALAPASAVTDASNAALWAASLSELQSHVRAVAGVGAKRHFRSRRGLWHPAADLVADKLPGILFPYRCRVSSYLTLGRFISEPETRACWMQVGSLR